MLKFSESFLFLTGYYCEEGTTNPTPCPEGTLSNTEGNVNVTNCEPCTPGYYCEGTANTNYTGPCSPGYYCPAGSVSGNATENNCTIGHHCPEASRQPIPCSAGYYQDEIRQSQCKPCSAGRLIIEFNF